MTPMIISCEAVIGKLSVASGGVAGTSAPIIMDICSASVHSGGKFGVVGAGPAGLCGGGVLCGRGFGEGRGFAEGRIAPL